MSKFPNSRWLAGLGAIGALVVTASGPVTATAALATEPQLGVYFTDVTVATSGSGKSTPLVINSAEQIVLRDLKVTYDAADLVDKVRITPDTSRCVADGAKVTCEVPYDQEVGPYGLATFPIVLKAQSGAEPGDQGILKISLSADGVGPITREATIRVGEGVDLRAHRGVEVTSRPGGSFTAQLPVTNAGSTVVDGAAVTFGGTGSQWGLPVGKKFSNCHYAGDALVSCEFDQELAAGARYTLSVPFTVAPDTRAPSTQDVWAQWHTAAEFADYDKYLRDRGYDRGTPGTDGKLTLIKAGLAAQGLQADTDPSNNWTHLAVKITGSNRADLEALGAKLTGAAGDTVTAKVGFRNNGPAALRSGGSDSPVTHLLVQIPTGTTAVTVPDRCFPAQGEKADTDDPGKAGATSYLCYGPTSIEVGEEKRYEFGLRIDKVVADAAGTVTVNAKCACDGGYSEDLKPANDVAKILVNASAGGGAGDGLPVTGANAGAVAGIGGLLLAAGVAGFVLARRRRTRFVA